MPGRGNDMEGTQNSLIEIGEAEADHLLVPLLGIRAGLIVLAIYRVHRSVRRIRKQDAVINGIKQQDPGLAEFYRDQL
jgi:hypothetical protein